jgi:F0F1-type ATP synthase membrane subunit b/b'
LGEQQARLAEQQRKIIEDVRRQLKPIVEDAIREGKGKVISIE